MKINKTGISEKLLELSEKGFLTEIELEGKLEELKNAKTSKEAGQVIKSLLLEEALG